MAAYDVIVIGLGTHGSAAAAELARRGAKILGVERFARGHELGSFIGRSRIIRLAYFEHPDYVPLLRRAWDRWLELEREWVPAAGLPGGSPRGDRRIGGSEGERLLHPTGGLYAGPPDSEIVAGSLRSAREHGLAHELLDTAELRRRFPWLRAEDGWAGLVEEQAGYLVPERCIAAHLAVAERHGAELRFGDGADDRSPDGSGFAVHTSGGRTERSERIVIAAGAWLPYFLPDLALPLEVERVPLFWLEPIRVEGLDRIPIYICETPEGSFYGFPYLADQGLKVARHGTGDVLQRRADRTDADGLDRSVRPGEEARVRGFVRRYLPDGDGRLREAKICMYTKTPDGHFIVDRHPAWPGVVFASACSGHGFKFASVMGEILADLALEGRTSHPIDFLSLARFAAAPRA